MLKNYVSYSWSAKCKLSKSANKVSWFVEKLQNGANVICEKPSSVFMKSYLLKRKIRTKIILPLEKLFHLMVQLWGKKKIKLLFDHHHFIRRNFMRPSR